MFMCIFCRSCRIRISGRERSVINALLSLLFGQIARVITYAFRRAASDALIGRYAPRKHKYTRHGNNYFFHFNPYKLHR